MTRATDDRDDAPIRRPCTSASSVIMLACLAWCVVAESGSPAFAQATPPPKAPGTGRAAEPPAPAYQIPERWRGAATVAALVIIFAAIQVPTIVAYRRGHPSWVGIGILSCVFGCTALGWVLLLFWAMRPLDGEPEVIKFTHPGPPSGSR